MADYTYWCDRCKKHFVISKPIKLYSPVEKCLHCQSEDMVSRDFREDTVYTTVKLALSEIKTVGHYAERNTEQKGKYEVEAMREDFVTKKEEKPLPAGFSKLTPEQYEKMPSKTKRRKRL